MTAFVLNQLIGGGGFASRLMEEVREKRGLAYSVYSYIQPFKHTSIFSAASRLARMPSSNRSTSSASELQAGRRRGSHSRRMGRTPRNT